jgi:acyl dehydratase
MKLFATLRQLLQVDFKEPTPAGEELTVRSQVVEVRDRQPRGAKSSVQVNTACAAEVLPENFGM